MEQHHGWSSLRPGYIRPYWVGQLAPRRYETECADVRVRLNFPPELPTAAEEELRVYDERAGLSYTGGLQHSRRRDTSGSHTHFNG